MRHAGHGRAHVVERGRWLAVARRARALHPVGVQEQHDRPLRRQAGLERVERAAEVASSGRRGAVRGQAMGLRVDLVRHGAPLVGKWGALVKLLRAGNRAPDLGARGRARDVAGAVAVGVEPPVERGVWRRGRRHARPAGRIGPRDGRPVKRKVHPPVVGVVHHARVVWVPRWDLRKCTTSVERARLGRKRGRRAQVALGDALLGHPGLLVVGSRRHDRKVAHRLESRRRWRRRRRRRRWRPGKEAWAHVPVAVALVVAPVRFGRLGVVAVPVRV